MAQERRQYSREFKLMALSRYRDWARAAPGREETELRDLVQRLSLENPRCGYRRITALVRREGWPANPKRIARIRGQDNLLALRRPAFRPATTDSVHGYTRWPNLVRKMVLTGVNQLWAADITYVRLDEAFVYLAVVLDVFSRKWSAGPWPITCAPNWRSRR